MSRGTIVKSKPEITALCDTVSQSPILIKHIQDPPELVQMTALQRDPSVIMFIRNPTSKVQQWILENHLNLFRFIKNPMPKFVTRLIKLRPDQIIYIHEPTDKDISIALNHRYFSPDLIIHFDPLYNYLKQNDIVNILFKKPTLLRYIKTQTTYMQMAALKNTLYVIPYLNNPDQEIIDYIAANFKSQYQSNTINTILDVPDLFLIKDLRPSVLIKYFDR